MRPIEWNNFWFILAALLTVFYNILALRFSGKILLSFSRKKLTLVFFATFNTLWIVFAQAFHFPHYLSYIAGALILFLEYSLLSKSTARQRLFGSAVFFLHVATIHILVIAIFSNITEVAPLVIFESFTLFYKSLSVSVIIMIFALTILVYNIQTPDIIKISEAKKYSKNLSIVSLFMIFFISLESYLLITNQSFRYILLVIAGTTIFCAMIFYYFFLYSINFVKMYVYKRKKEEIKDSHTEIIFEKQKIEQEIAKDGLTGLYTKKFIYDMLKDLCRIDKAKFSVIFIDLNGLKNVNDTYGHEVGDRYICRVAKSIQNGVREHDYAGRVGGDEFIIILDDIEEDDIQKIINRIHENVSIQNELEDFLVAISLGFVFIDNAKEKKSCESILSLADENMRKNKRDFYSMQQDGKQL